MKILSLSIHWLDRDDIYSTNVITKRRGKEEAYELTSEETSNNFICSESYCRSNYLQYPLETNQRS